MSFLNLKKNKSQVGDNDKKKNENPIHSEGGVGRDMATYVLGPRVTEKTARGSENNVYTFNISRNADKRRVARAIKEIYGVVPFQVRIISVRNKGVFFRGKRGKTSGGKKAYVYLRKEDKIEVL